MSHPSPANPPASTLDLSVIIPLYNCLPLTQACLTSLLANLPTKIAYEVILVDDGSTDGTREWLSGLRMPHLKVLLNESNLGYARSNNLACEIARGRILALLNNDLVLLPGWIEGMLAAVEATHEEAIVGNIQFNARDHKVDHAGISVNAKGKPEHIREIPLFAPARLDVPAVTGACMVIPRAVWINLGGFDEAYVNGGEDVDLCFRARAAGLKVVVATSSRVRHHVSQSPNRKRRDEENAYRLTLRWRASLTSWGMNEWVRHCLERDLTAATFGDPLEALHLAAFHLRLTRRPPITAVMAMKRAIDVEMSRWQQMLGPPSRFRT